MVIVKFKHQHHLKSMVIYNELAKSGYFKIRQHIARKLKTGMNAVMIEELRYL